jgi:hypothetical protein
VSAGVARWHTVLSSNYATAFHADYLRGCDTPLPFGDRSRTRCTWVAPHARGTVVLIGDSNAGQFTEPVVRAGTRAGFDVSVATASSCPFVRLRVASGSMDDCTRFNTGSLPALVRARPSLVVVAARTDAYISQSTVGLGVLGTRKLTYAEPQKALLWAQGLHSELAALNQAGIPVIVVRPVPVLPVDQDACAVILVLSGGCRASLSRRSVDRALRPALVAETRALVGLPLTSSLDFENELCTAERCSTERGKRVMYRNENHLSVAGALSFTPAFSRAIADHARPRRSS